MNLQKDIKALDKAIELCQTRISELRKLDSSQSFRDCFYCLCEARTALEKKMEKIVRGGKLK